MKKVLMLLGLVLFFGCQQEELSVLAEEEENNEATLDAQMISLIQTVAAHDGSFDDMVDRSSCFSINFPYQVSFEGEPYQINSVLDLVPINPGDDVVPIYPIVLAFADYHNVEVSSHDEFLALIAQCAEGRLYNDRVTCIDFLYPISMAVYDPSVTNFETRQMNHDKSTFLQLSEISPTEKVSINYPIEMRWLNGTLEQIGSNEELMGLILDARDLCLE